MNQYNKQEDSDENEVTAFVKKHTAPNKNLYCTTSLEEVHSSILALTNFYSEEIDPPIEEYIASGMVRRLIELLSPFYYQRKSDLITKIREKCALLLSWLCEGTVKETEGVADTTGAPETLVKLISDSNLTIAEHAAFCVGKFSTNYKKYRDRLTNLGAIKIVTDNIFKNACDKNHRKFTNTLFRTLGLLNSGNNPPQKQKHLNETIKVIEKFNTYNDPYKFKDTLIACEHLCNVTEKTLDAVLFSRIFTRILELMNILAVKVETKFVSDKKLLKLAESNLSQMCKVIVNISGGSEKANAFIIDSGLVECLKPIFFKYDNKQEIPIVRQKIILIISYLSPGPTKYFRACIEKHTIPIIAFGLEQFEIETLNDSVNLFVFISKTGDDLAPDILDRMMDVDIIGQIKKSIKLSSLYVDVVERTIGLCNNLIDLGNKEQVKTGTNRVKDRMIEIGLDDVIEEAASKFEGIFVEHALPFLNRVQE